MHTSIKKTILDADVDFLVATIKVSLCDQADHAMNTGVDDFVDDLTGGCIEETATLGTKTTTGGAFDSADPTFTAAAGDPCEYLELWCDTAGASSTDNLIAGYDTATSGLPVTLNGGDVVVQVHTSGWFSI